MNAGQYNKFKIGLHESSEPLLTTTYGQEQDLCHFFENHVLHHQITVSIVQGRGEVSAISVLSPKPLNLVAKWYLAVEHHIVRPRAIKMLSSYEAGSRYLAQGKVPGVLGLFQIQLKGLGDVVRLVDPVSSITLS